MADNSIKVTLIKSMAGQLANIRNSARGLGLRRIGHSVVVVDTPANRGMVNTAMHMLKVEPAAQAGAREDGSKKGAAKKGAAKKAAAK